jgi:hypothetical protein
MELKSLAIVLLSIAIFMFLIPPITLSFNIAGVIFLAGFIYLWDSEE